MIAEFSAYDPTFHFVVTRERKVEFFRDPVPQRSLFSPDAYVTGEIKLSKFLIISVVPATYERAVRTSSLMLMIVQLDHEVERISR